MRRNTVAGTVALLTAIVALAFAGVADARTRGCGYAGSFFVKANTSTSCGFARNVARGFSRGDYTPRAYSAATGRHITMRCHGSYRYAYCTGGHGAFVSLSR